MTARELRAPTPSEPRRILVAVDEACASPSLCRNLRAHAGSEPFEVFVVSPTHGVATQWYVDEDAARADATARLRACVACLRRQGIRTCGGLAAPDPVEAIAEALEVFPADRILLVTAPRRPSPWLQRSVIDRARRVFTQPIDHVVVPHAAGKDAT